jgi:hypothetical protein
MTVQNDARNLQNFGIGQLAPVVDKSTNVRSSIDWIHREVHEGNHWFTADSVTLADVDDLWCVDLALFGDVEGSSRPYRFEMAFAVQTTAGVLVRLHENGVIDEEADPFLLNNRRESLNTTQIGMYSGSAVIGDGTIIAQAAIGNAVFGGELKWFNNRARLMGYGKRYALEMKATVAGAIVSWQIEIVERDEKA